MTLSMKVAVRALSLFLTVWLTAATAFPPCCWSMTDAHEHQQTQDSSASDASSAGHHHHGSDESVALAGTTSALSPIQAYDCDTESAEAATITSAAKPPADSRLAGETVDIVAPPLSTRVVARADRSPPGSSSSAAFLNPLRI